MKRFGILVGAFALGLSAAAQAQSQPAPQAQEVTLSALIGTWKGGPADSTGTPVAGKDTSMTLTMRSDSTYTWTGQDVPQCAQKPGSKWKQLSANNISWCGGAGYDLKLEGKKLFVSQVMGPDKRVGNAVVTSGKKRKYFTFTQIDTQPKP